LTRWNRSGDWSDGLSLRLGERRAPGVWCWGEGAQGGDALAETLLMDPRPQNWLGDGPWAVVIRFPDGAILASVSSSLTAGLFWSDDLHPDGAPLLLVAPRLGSVVQARRRPTQLHGDYLLDTLLLRPSAEDSPYQGVHRLSPGTSLRWSQPRRTPIRQVWCGPEVWPPAHREGGDTRQRYLETFDQAVDGLVQADQPLCATLSGGLDSPFVVASLVRHATPARPIHAFIHRPHPAAPPLTLANSDPDEGPLAQAMAAAYPGLIRAIPVVVPEEELPLDGARAWAETTWAPTINPANTLWYGAMGERARALGAHRLFMGGLGNAVYSGEHHYAARYYAARGDLGRLLALVRRGRAGGLSWSQAWRRRLLVPLLAPWRQHRHRPQGPTYAELIGLAALEAPPQPLMDRQRFLRWMRFDSGLNLMTQADGHGLLPVDPFSCRTVQDFAAAITPLEWCQGPYPRGYGRLLAEGRVPDAIRLRTRHGLQSADSWYRIRHQRQRYRQELQLLESTPLLAELLDLDRVRRTVEAWPWGEGGGAPLLEVFSIDRLLSVAGFLRFTSARLEQLAQRPPREPAAPDGEWQHP